MSKYRSVMFGVCAVFVALLMLCRAHAQVKPETVSYGANRAAGHYSHLPFPAIWLPLAVGALMLRLTLS